MLERRGLLAPRTAVDSFLAKNGCLFIISSSGANLDYFTSEDLSLQTRAGSVEVFKTHAIHGIHCKKLKGEGESEGEGIIIVYGDKTVTILNQEGFETQCSLTLPDLVLDCQLITPQSLSPPSSSDTASLHYILVGTAHNFIDVFDYDHGQRHLQRFQHSICACLFSLTIASSLTSSSVHIASGTAFGKILLWNLHDIGLDGYEGADSERKASMSYGKTLVGHEGVIFRVAFNKDCSRVASVSDDRTVRVWEFYSGEQLFVGWGHVCRVWDVIFYGEKRHGLDTDEDENYILTCGEDCTIKLWAYSKGQEALTTLRGHGGKSCWRIHALPEAPSSSSLIAATAMSRFIVSTGNDASIKVWDMCLRRQVSANDPSGGRIINLPVPEWDHSKHGFELEVDISTGTMDSSNKARRSRTIIMIRGHPSGSHWLVVTINGCVYRVNNKYKNCTAKSAEEYATEPISEWKWSQILQIQKQVSTVEVLFEETDEYLIVGHPDGYISVVELFWHELEYQYKQCEWKAHQLRAVRIWLARIQGQLCALTAIAKGVCSLWSLVSLQSPTLLFTCTTARKDIATAFYVSTVECVIIGDSRGSLSFYKACFTAPAIANLGAGEVIDCLSPAYHFKCHSPEPVSLVGGYIDKTTGYEEEIIVSLGHDAHVNTYRWHQESSQYILITRLSTLPITTPDFFFFDGAGATFSTYIGGYQSSIYHLLDLQRGYELLHIDAGGWKRPHSCQLVTTTNSSLKLSIPSVIYVVFIPERMTNGACKESSLSILQNNDDRFEEDYNRNVIDAGHLGACAHGKVTYCGTTVKLPNHEKLLVIGGEEGNLRSYLVSPCLRNISFQQTLEFPSNRPVRCVAGCLDMSGTRGIIVAAGSKLHYAIYTYNIQGIHRDFASISSVGYSLNSFFTTACAGSTWSQATQDHRILSSSVSCTINTNFLAVLCDSRGMVSLISFDLAYPNNGPDLIESFKGSEHPLISSDICIVKCGSRRGHPHSAMKRKCQEGSIDVSLIKECTAVPSSSSIIISVLGDTAGLVSVWLLQGSRSMPEVPVSDFDSSLVNSRFTFAYQAHSMGANTIRCVEMDKNIHEDAMYTLISVSGGDDQSICACIFHIRNELDTKVDSSLSMSAELLVCYRFDDCMGSAIKGVQYVHDHLIGVGYDQRLSLWKVKIDAFLLKRDGKKDLQDLDVMIHEPIRVSRESQVKEKTASMQTLAPSLASSVLSNGPSISMEWVEGTVVQIGDINALHVDVDVGVGEDSCGSREIDAVAIGEGYQLFKLTLQ